MSLANTIKSVQEIKASLSKELLCEENSPNETAFDVERCLDLLRRLDEQTVTLNVLTKTLIGTVVSKFKTHHTLGPIAKALVKKWKKLAKDLSTKTNSDERNESSRKATTSAAIESNVERLLCSCHSGSWLLFLDLASHEVLYRYSFSEVTNDPIPYPSQQR